MSDAWLTVIVAVVMVIGLFGTVVPFVPGLLLLWGAALVYGLLVDFGLFGTIVMVLLTLVVAVSIAKSVIIPRRVAEGHGVSVWSQAVAVICAVVGFFVIPVVGIVVGALVGLFLAECANQGDVTSAWQATLAVAKGFGVSALIDFGLGLVMISLWLGWAVTVVW